MELLNLARFENLAGFKFWRRSQVFHGSECTDTNLDYFTGFHRLEKGLQFYLRLYVKGVELRYH